MRHSYIAPQANLVRLHVEDAILSMSKYCDVVSEQAQLSNQSIWNCENWNNTSEEEEN